MTYDGDIVDTWRAEDEDAHARAHVHGERDSKGARAMIIRGEARRIVYF